MSKPAEKAGGPLESYSPKKNPEILNLMENAGKINMTYEVKTANGGSYISGIPFLKWGLWQDCTYGGALALIFDAMGVETNYEEIMGFSGACYKIVMNDSWGPESEMLQVGVNCEYNITRALGIDMYCIGDDIERDINVIKNLDNGYPVLACGQRDAPEWTIITGYERKFDKINFFGRTYFDCGTDEYKYPLPKEEEIFTENQYFHANQYPGTFPQALLRFFDRKGDPVDKKSALKTSLETCIRSFEELPSHYKQGYDAYDILIAGFELDDESYQTQCTNDQYHIGSLQDARRAAYIFLERNANLLSGKNEKAILAVSNLYKTMLKNLLTVIPYEKTSAIFNASSNPVWSEDKRFALSAVLKENKAFEEQAQDIIKTVLDQWDN